MKSLLWKYGNRPDTTYICLFIYDLFDLHCYIEYCFKVIVCKMLHKLINGHQEFPFCAQMTVNTVLFVYKISGKLKMIFLFVQINRNIFFSHHNMLSHFDCVLRNN